MRDTTPPNPAQVRQWEERIARKIEGFSVTYANSLPHIHIWVDPRGKISPSPPNYSKSLPDLFRALKLTDLQWSLNYYPTSDTYCLFFLGAMWFDASSHNTPEDAAFRSLCQYLAHYHPTPGEEQERIERGAEG